MAKKNKSKASSILVLPPPEAYQWSMGAAVFFLTAPAFIGLFIALFISLIPSGTNDVVYLHVISAIFIVTDVALQGYLIFLWKFRIPAVGCSEFFIKKQRLEISSNRDTVQLNPKLVKNTKAEKDDFGFH